MRRVLSIVGVLIFSAPAWGQSNACDLTKDGKVDQNDVQSAINMALGTSTCSANVFGNGVCNVVVVQRVTNASLPGGTCLTGTGEVTHSVSLSWTASNSSGVTGYKVYRGTASGGPYTLLTTVGASTSYTDNSIQSGQTYYYVITAINSSAESSYSGQAQAVIPTP
jgi:fibronectin type 3 domain-containing protein